MGCAFGAASVLRKDKQRNQHCGWIQRANGDWHEPWMSVGEGTEALISHS